MSIINKMNKGKSFALKPNLSLINASFEGYKLKLYSDLDVTSFLANFKGFQQTKSDVGYLHTKLISLYNHIHSDPFNTSIAFVFDTNYKLHLFSLEQINSSSKVLSCIQPENCPHVSELIVPPSITFPSEILALTSNGFNKVRLYETNDHSKDNWQILLEIDAVNSIIAHCLVNESNKELHILLVSVVNIEDLKKDESLCNLEDILQYKTQCISLHKLEWLTLGNRENKWDVIRKQILVGSGEIEFLALTKECDHVVLLGKEPYSFVYDSMMKILPREKAQNVVKCQFRQCSKTVTILVTITDTNLEEIEVDMSSGLEIRQFDGTLFKRIFYSTINADSASWKLGDGKIEINLTKSEDGFWNFLFKDDNDNVDEIGCLAEGQRNQINATVERMMIDPESEKPAYNPGELEDCDENNEEYILVYLNGQTHACSRFSVLNSTKPLFTTVCQSPCEPGFCLRHDVDGILWTLDETGVPKHSATFNAFGYVRASKTMAKYTSVPSDNSYVVVCDVAGHMYVFYQSRTIEGELRNRRSGSLIPTYAQQLVITLKNRDEVMGIYAVKEGILVLNHDKVTFYSLPINV